MYIGVPVIVASVEVVSVSVGEDVNLPCHVFGHPLIIQWFKKEKKLAMSLRHEMTSNGTLTISRTTTSDSGMYLCMASNSLGNDTKRTQLIVKSKYGC